MITSNGWLNVNDVVLFVSPANAILLKQRAEWIFPIGTAEEAVPPERQRFSTSYYHEERHEREVGGPGFFILEIFFGAGRKPLVFQPSKTVLHVEHDQVHPEAFFELRKRRESTNQFIGHRPYWQLCSDWRYTVANPLRLTRGQDPAIRLEFLPGSQHCLAIKFPTSPPDPREPFLIEINGIDIDGRPTPIRIKYVPDMATDRHA